MENKLGNKKYLIAIPLALLLCFAIMLYPNGTFIRIAYADDEYGDDINWVAVYQWNGTDYELRHNITSGGGTYRIHDNQVTKFVVNISFNSTLVSSEADAISYTSVYMNITNEGTIWLDKELNNTDCTLVGDFYILNENGVWNSTGKPTAGVTYECSVLYKGYY